MLNNRKAFPKAMFWIYERKRENHRKTENKESNIHEMLSF